MSAALVYPACGTRWKIVDGPGGDEARPCPSCEPPRAGVPDAVLAALAKTKVTLAVLDDALVLAMRAPTHDTVAVAMSAREADHLAGRLRKATSELRSSAGKAHSG